MTPETERPYITCRQVVDFIMDYLNGDLAPEQRREFDRHMAVCPSCVVYLKTYQETIRLGRAALQDTDEPVGEKVPEDLVQAILAARRKTS